MEKIGESIERIFNGKNSDDRLSPDRPPKPVSRCTVCGEPHEYNWIENEFFLKVNGKSAPFWVQAECSKCMEAEKLVKQKIQDEQIFQRRLEKTGLRERFKAKNFDNYHLTSNTNLQGQKEAVNICRNFAVNFKEAYGKGTFLLLLGNPGTGKGHLSAAITSKVTRQGYSVICVKARDMFRRLKETWRVEPLEKESDIIQQLCKTDLLIIDDIGVQFKSKTEQDFLYDILDGRYEDYRPTICTSNLTFQAFQELIGDRLFDRFFDTESGSRVVMFDWESYRRTGDGR